jgi:lipopolysaccharide/colanic/teichoic acid biosynthesis glycosyltransferase
LPILHVEFFQLIDPQQWAVPRGKRALDLLVLLLLAPLALPLALLIAITVFLDSPGPVIFRAARIGMDGRVFEMRKFRTMRVGMAGTAIAGSDDLRITPVGRFLRASRLDELPQLWNVLRGEMSMVGPRPELEEFVELHAEDYRQILTVSPGLTGPTQLRFAGVEASLLSTHHDPEAFYRDELLPDKVAMDLDYARHRSNHGDLKVLLQTLGLPLILALQGLADDPSESGPRRAFLVAGAVMAGVVLPALFALGLGSPR